MVMQDLKEEPENSAAPRMSLGLQFLVAAAVPVVGLFLAIAANSMSAEVWGFSWLGPTLMLASLLLGVVHVIPLAKRANASESPVAVLGAIFLFIEYPFLALLMVGAHAFRFGIAA
jgi:hypothetical protein